MTLAARVGRLWHRLERLGQEPRFASDAVRFTGDYHAWVDASRDAAGYDAPEILTRTRDAMIRVRRDGTLFERDSVILDHAEYPTPVIAGLLRACCHDGRLDVVDFGGALGSTYFQCRPFLRDARAVTWTVVEQPNHVACGRELFGDGPVQFRDTIEACLAGRPNVLLMSGVLQYLPEPYESLARLLRLAVPHVIVDRTAFLQADRDRLTVQATPDWIYPATYPAWFLSETKIRRVFTTAGYALVAEFPGADRVAPDDEPAYFKGFLYERPGD